MTRLEDEFRHMLLARVLDLEIEALAGLSSLSMANDRSNSDATEAAAGEEDDGSVSSSVDGRSSYRSLQSIREIDLFPVDAISDLHTKVRSSPTSPPHHCCMHLLLTAPPSQPCRRPYRRCVRMPESKEECKASRRGAR
uniref:Uncharacterized protein n=1 Tax=Zea mays TaxID=4577 RepID=A0A804QTC3_MAIZE